jgi:hypothetical protein
MKNKLLTAVVLASLALLASGCAHQSKNGIDPRAGVEGYNAALVTRPKPTAPNIFLDRNRFAVVDQEPIRIFREDTKDGVAEIVWALPANGPFRFNERNGITLTGAPQGTVCAPKGNSGRLFSCTYKFQPGTRFKYAVSLTLDGQQLPVLDPEIVNME